MTGFAYRQSDWKDDMQIFFVLNRSFAGFLPLNRGHSFLIIFASHYDSSTVFGDVSVSYVIIFAQAKQMKFICKI